MRSSPCAQPASGGDPGGIWRTRVPGLAVASYIQNFLRGWLLFSHERIRHHSAAPLAQQKQDGGEPRNNYPSL